MPVVSALRCRSIKKRDREKIGIDNVTVLCYTAVIEIGIGGSNNASINLRSRETSTNTPR